MRNASDLHGMSVIAIADGKKLGSVDEVVVSPQDLRVLGLVMKEPGFLNHSELIIETADIRAIGADAITVDGQEAARISEEAAGAFRDARSVGRSLTGNKAVTESGDLVGTVSDFAIDEDTYRVTSLLLSGSLLSGGDVVQADRVISVGPDVIVVRNSRSAE